MIGTQRGYLNQLPTDQVSHVWEDLQGTQTRRQAAGPAGRAPAWTGPGPALRSGKGVREWLTYREAYMGSEETRHKVKISQMSRLLSWVWPPAALPRPPATRPGSRLALCPVPQGCMLAPTGLPLPPTDGQCCGVKPPAPPRLPASSPHVGFYQFSVCSTSSLPLDPLHLRLTIPKSSSFKKNQTNSSCQPSVGPLTLAPTIPLWPSAP